MGHARALLSLSGEQQLQAAETIIARTLSVRDTENLVRHFDVNASAAKTKSPFVKTTQHALQDRLAQKFGLPVSVTQNAQGRGKIIIRFKSEDELEAILQ